MKDKDECLLGRAVREDSQGSTPVVAWLPIETAPDDEDVLLFFPDAREEYQVMVGHRCSDHYGDWYQQDVDLCPDPLDVMPTHWMPLPSPPEDAK